MSLIEFVLVCDGSSDSLLIPIITWSLTYHFPHHEFQGGWADTRQLKKPPKDLVGRITEGLRLNKSATLLFVHRDAERDEKKTFAERKAEIQKAMKNIKNPTPYVCVIPVRMMEAWLLFDEQAIRTAAGNPNGKVKLRLPPIKSLESLPDPKETLYALLRKASELQGRDLDKFRPQRAIHDILERIDDFSPLRHLSAFQTLESDIRQLEL
ncbi:MAG: hypothetical protein ACOYL5_08920 [Phototrophicaceae bacterium]